MNAAQSSPLSTRRATVRTVATARPPEPLNRIYKTRNAARPLTILSTMSSSSDSIATRAPFPTARTVVLHHDYLLEQILINFESPLPSLQSIPHLRYHPDENEQQQINRHALLSIAATSRKLSDIGSRVLWRNLDEIGLAHFVDMIHTSLISDDTSVSSLLFLNSHTLLKTSIARPFCRKHARQSSRPASGPSSTQPNSDT